MASVGSHNQVGFESAKLQASLSGQMNQGCTWFASAGSMSGSSDFRFILLLQYRIIINGWCYQTVVTIPDGLYLDLSPIL